MAEARHNMRNPAVKRILQEIKEMAKEQSDQYMSMPLEEDIFEWQFAIHGPKDSEFEGGIYHGRITLPSQYPFKPPSFMLLSPSGRFEIQTKICLSISNHHPEHWQPSWSVRTALVALIAFMPTKPNGALGSLEFTKKERRALAIKSRQQCPQFGSPERQNVINQIHEAMLRSAPPVPTTPLVEDDTPAASVENNQGEQGALNEQKVNLQLTEQGVVQEVAGGATGEGTSSGEASTPGQSVASGQQEPAQQAALQPLVETALDDARQNVTPLRLQAAEPAPAPAPAIANRVVEPAERPLLQRPAAASFPARTDTETYQEWLLSAVAAILVLGILFILGQKIARSYTGIALAGSESEL